MITTHKYKNLTWTDVESPTVEDIKILMPQYGIPPIVADELLKPTIRPKADVYGNIIYLILHFPIYDISRKVSEPCEVDFILGKNFIITAHYKSIIPLHELVRAQSPRSDYSLVCRKGKSREFWAFALPRAGTGPGFPHWPG